MSVEQTLSIIKPDGIQKNLIGEIYNRFEKAGLEIVASKMLHQVIATLEETTSQFIHTNINIRIFQEKHTRL